MSSPSPAEPFTNDETPTNVRWLIFALACGTSWFLYLHRFTFNIIRPELKAEYGWTDLQTQSVYAAFNITYGLGQIPSGILCDFMGPHLFLGSIICLWSVALPLQGLAANRGLLQLIRLVFGAAQAGAFPILAKVSRTWFPVSYRTSVQACIATLSGRGGGAMASIIMAGFLMGYCKFSWRESLWILGIAGLLFAALFVILFRNSPETDSRVNSAELRHILAGQAESPRSSDRQFLSWSLAFTNRSLWFLLIQQSLVAGVDTIFGTYTYEFFRSQGVSKELGGWLTSLPLLGGAIGGTFAGFLNDALLRNDRKQIARICMLMGAVLGGVVLTVVRGGYTTQANLVFSTWLSDTISDVLSKTGFGCAAGALAGGVAASLLFLVAGRPRWCRSVVGCVGVLGASLMFVVVSRQANVMVAAAAFFALKFFADFQQPTQWAACTDIGGRFSATLFGIVNTASNVGGILIPLLFGLLNDANTREVILNGAVTRQINFTPMLQVSAGMYIIAAGCWLMVNSTQTLDKASENDR